MLRNEALDLPREEALPSPREDAPPLLPREDAQPLPPRAPPRGGVLLLPREDAPPHHRRAPLRDPPCAPLRDSHRAPLLPRGPPRAAPLPRRCELPLPLGCGPRLAREFEVPLRWQRGKKKTLSRVLSPLSFFAAHMPSPRTAGWRYVSFASAGTMGVSYCGVLDALEDVLGPTSFSAWRESVRGIAGCSSGAIAALLFALGVTREARLDLLGRHDVRSVVLDRVDLAMLWNRYGIATSAEIADCVRDVLTTGGLSATSTFADLKRLLRVDYACVATDLDAASTVVFSADATPDVLVCDAVCASCCIPVAFPPVRIGERHLVDGCLTCQLPDLFPRDATLFVTVEGAPRIDATQNWVSYLSALMRCASGNQRFEADLRETFPSSLLAVDLRDAPPFDVQMGEAERDRALARGYAAGVDFLTGGEVTRQLLRAASAYVVARCTPLLLTEDDESPPGDGEARAATPPRTP